MNPYKSRRRAKIVSIIIIIVMVVSSLSFVAMLPFMGVEDSTAHGAEPVSAAAATSHAISDTDLDGISSSGLNIDGITDPGTSPGTSTSPSTSADSDADLIKQAGELVQMIEIVKDNYKDKVTNQQLIDGAFNGVISSLNDPFSAYYSSEKEKDSFMQDVAGVFGGVGIRIVYRDDHIVVDSVLPDTPAEKAHMQAGDVITEVDGVSLEGKSASDAADLLRGAPGSSVILNIQRGDQKLSVTMKREIIQTVDVTDKLLDNHIGYIKLASFGANTSNEFKQAMLKQIKEGATSLILDLRDNLGGFLESAVGVADQLVKKGPIIYEEQQGKTVETIEASGQANTDIPIVVLVNGDTASASEALTGILQDTKRATVIGTTTYGKGIAQQIMNLGDGKAMKLSVVYYLTPSKKKIDHVGITPDITVQNIKPEDVKKLAAEYLSFAPMSEKVKPKQGDTGLNVYGAQQRLAMLGYKIAVNGTLDADTAAAVKQFQKSQGFQPYGVLDYATMNALDQAARTHVKGQDSEDLQLQKAIEVLSGHQAAGMKDAA